MPNWKHSIILLNDCGEFIFKNETDYSPELRTNKAEVLIAAHVDTNQVENFISVNSENYLTKLEYSIFNSLDGHYRFELLRFPTHDSSGSTTYYPEVKDINDIIITYADLVYYTLNNKFYKNIQTTNSVLPSDINGLEFWEEIIDFKVESVRKNNKIDVGIFNDINDCRSKKCTKDELYKINCKDSSCIDVKTLLPFLKKAIYLSGAQSKNDDNQPEKAEVILRTLDNMCKGC